MPKTEVPVAEKKTQKKKRRVRRKKLPVDLEEDFVSRVKDAVVFLQRGPEPSTSIRSFVQDALESRLRSVERKHGPIPGRKNVKPRQGRPMT